MPEHTPLLLQSYGKPNATPATSTAAPVPAASASSTTPAYLRRRFSRRHTTPSRLPRSFPNAIKVSDVGACQGPSLRAVQLRRRPEFGGRIDAGLDELQLPPADVVP